VTSDTASTDMETLVQRLRRSSTSIKPGRPAWKRTSDVVAADTADTLLLERLNHLTTKLVTLITKDNLNGTSKASKPLPFVSPPPSMDPPCQSTHTHPSPMRKRTLDVAATIMVDTFLLKR